MISITYSNGMIKVKRRGKKPTYFRLVFEDSYRKIAESALEIVSKKAEEILGKHNLSFGKIDVKRHYIFGFCPICNLGYQPSLYQIPLHIVFEDGEIKREIKINNKCEFCNRDLIIYDTRKSKAINDKILFIEFPKGSIFLKDYPSLRARIVYAYVGNGIFYDLIAIGGKELPEEKELEKIKDMLYKKIIEYITNPFIKLYEYILFTQNEILIKNFENEYESLLKKFLEEELKVKEKEIEKPIVEVKEKDYLEERVEKEEVKEVEEKKLEVEEISLSKIKDEIEKLRYEARFDFSKNTFLQKIEIAKRLASYKLMEEELLELEYKVLKGLIDLKEGYENLDKLVPQLKRLI